MSSQEWKPDRALSLPLQQQIMEHIKSKIKHGEWPPGTRIPSQRRLAEQFGVNRSTVVAALDELTADGFLEGNRGGGTTVVNHTWSLLAAAPPPDWTSYVKSGIQASNLPTIQEINRAEFRTDLIRLGTGELGPDLLPHREMKEVLNELSGKPVNLGYEEPRGSIQLREQLAQHVKKYGIQASPSSILIVSGALQALHLISIGLLHRGSAILTEKPSYLYSVPIFESAGMKLAGLPMDHEGIQASLIPQYKKQYNAALLYTIPSFHNPTGTLMTQARREQLLQLCSEAALPVIEDDVYGELWIDAPPPKPLKAIDTSGAVLYLGSLSKTVSPGLRIGWVIGPEPVINRLADIKMQTDYGASSLSGRAAAEWLSSPLYEEHLQRVRRELTIRRALTTAVLKEHFTGVAQWHTPSGGFYIWLQIDAAVSLHALFAAAMKEGLLLNPGHLYHRETYRYLRISYAYAPAADLEAGLIKLASILKQLLVEA